MLQQNRVMERKIVMDHGHAYAMLLAAWLTEKAWNLLMTEAKSTATKLSDLAWNQQVKGIPNDLFNGPKSNATYQICTNWLCDNLEADKEEVGW